MLKNITLLIYIIWIKIKGLFFYKKDIPHILIIKTDAIGDYILFRNYLIEIALSSKYKRHKITLVCNVVIKDLIIELDGQIIDNFIYIDHKATSKEWFVLFRELAKFKYYTIINFHFSRNLINELITFSALSAKKITMSGNYLQIKPYLKKIINLIYSSLVSIPNGLENEFEINKFFTEYIILKKLSYTHPQISILDSKKYPQFNYTSSHIIIAPGAGASYRQLSTPKLVELVSFLIEKYTVCFIGSASDTLIVDSVKQQLPQQNLDKLIDLTGKTSLKFLPYILNNSLCIIGNDSGIYHMGVALNKPVLCIAGGGHFERFVKYEERANIKVCYQPMPCYNCNWNCIYKVDLNCPYPCISSIGTNDVLEKFKLIENVWT